MNGLAGVSPPDKGGSEKHKALSVGSLLGIEQETALPAVGKEPASPGATIIGKLRNQE